MAFDGWQGLFNTSIELDGLVNNCLTSSFCNCAKSICMGTATVSAKASGVEKRKISATAG